MKELTVDGGLRLLTVVYNGLEKQPSIPQRGISHRNKPLQNLPPHAYPHHRR